VPDHTRVERVDGDGVHLRAGEDTVVDVLFDGRRIWSFWTLRDSVDGVAPWPPQLRRFLDGSTRLAFSASLRPVCRLARGRALRRQRRCHGR